MEDNFEDVISYDVDKCRNTIANLRTEIEELVSTCNGLVDKLQIFQTINHDMEGTAISEDYKDIAVIFGDQGFNNFVTQLDQTLNSIEETVNSWEQTLIV